MDVANTPQLAKRPAPPSERSRYEVVGYPKSTRAPRRGGSTCDKLRGTAPPRQLRPQPSQSTLKGFEMRIIDTHQGKAVVHAPVLSGPSQGSECDDVPELPPPSAAELRYNAQRALISSTAILRTAVASKHEQPGKAATVRREPGYRLRPKSLARTASERAQSLRMAASGGSPNRFQINIQFESEQADAPPDRAPPVGSARTCITSSELEQGSASVASVLEQWGFSTPTSAPPGAGGPQQGQDVAYDTDEDSAGEDTLRLVDGIAQGRSPTM
ncbi:hypothetical protein IWW52_002338, partial [Coemansia sp. RSA 2704]